MIRKNYTLTPTLAEQLEKEAVKKEISASELLRKILESHFKGRKP